MQKTKQKSKAKAQYQPNLCHASYVRFVHQAATHIYDNLSRASLNYSIFIQNKVNLREIDGFVEVLV